MSECLNIGMPSASFLPNLGGAEVGLHNIAKRLVRLGHNPVVMTSWRHWRKIGQERWLLPYSVVPFPPKLLGSLNRLPLAAFMISNGVFEYWQRRYGIHVWHATFGYPTGVMLTHYMRHRSRPGPYLVRCVGDDIQMVPEIGYGMRLDPAIDAIVRSELPHVEQLTATCQTVVDEYARLGIPQSRIEVIPNGVDTARFERPVDRRNLRRELAIPEDAFLFLCVGRFHKKKNFSLALKVMAGFSAAERQAHNPHLLIVGKGVSALQAEANALGVQQCVRLFEPDQSLMQPSADIDFPSEKILQAYKSADAFLMPSLVETFGMVLVEAMAAGLPVITTDAPGCIDVVRRGQDGLMVPNNDVVAMKIAAQQVMGDAELRADLQGRSRKRAVQFDWDTVVGQYVGLYRDLIRRNRQA